MISRAALLGESLAHFLGGALATFIAVHIGIPVLSARWNIRPVIAWFLSSGALVAFFCCAAIAGVRRQTGAGSVLETLNALRLRRPKPADLAWALGGVMSVALLTERSWQSRHGFSQVTSCPKNRTD